MGTHATPENLVERLLDHGMVDDEPTPLAIGMVLTEAPAQAPVGFEVRPAGSADERLASARIAALAFGGPEPSEAPPPGDRNNVDYLAWLDGEPVARATASFGPHGVTLFGGATIPEARGRGAYRALVAARWDDAVARAPRWSSRRPVRCRARSWRASASVSCARSASCWMRSRQNRRREGLGEGRLRGAGRRRARGGGDGPVKGERIAQAQKIPPNFLENILLDLRNAGLVASRRGQDGGYWLARPPSR